MWELRWVLLGLGALVVIGVYLWSKGLFRGRDVSGTRPQRSEPTLEQVDIEPAPVAGADATPATPIPNRKPARDGPDRIIALRLIPRDAELSSERAVLALRGAGLQHGRFGIFHRLAEGIDEVLFSVASLTEPGSFNLANLSETTIAGLSFFIVLPGDGDPVERFDTMIQTARALAVELDADLHDERGSSWSIQRERYVREEIIEYRHQLERR
jgi:cell division protein ZipA